MTILTKKRSPFFGEIVDSQVVLSGMGEIATNCWLEIPTHHAKGELILGEFVVMPDHVHGIVAIYDAIDKEVTDSDSVRAWHAMPLRDQADNTAPGGIFGRPVSGSLSTIVASYKSAVTKTARRCGFQDFAWHRGFHDRIIRDQDELIRIEDYIRSNPENWGKDDNETW